jgi:putative FmdB family regulatory protein
MPIYEYECQVCKHLFERSQKISDPDPAACEACGQGPIRKLISLSGFVLKGGGFYTTEYPSASRKAAAETAKDKK